MEEKAIELLEGLAQQLNTTADMLWACLLKQAHIEGMAWLIFYGLSLLVFLICWRVYKRRKIRYEAEEIDADSYISANLIMAVVCVVLTIVIVSTVNSTLSALFNPEYWALQEVLKLF